MVLIGCITSQFLDEGDVQGSLDRASAAAPGVQVKFPNRCDANALRTACELTGPTRRDTNWTRTLLCIQSDR